MYHNLIWTTLRFQSSIRHTIKRYETLRPYINIHSCPNLFFKPRKAILPFRQLSGFLSDSLCCRYTSLSLRRENVPPREKSDNRPAEYCNIPRQPCNGLSPLDCQRMERQIKEVSQRDGERPDHLFSPYRQAT